MKQGITSHTHESKPFRQDLLQIQVGKVKQDLNVRDILFIKALGDYIIIQTSSKKVIVLSTMTEIMNRLPSDIFVRSHKSYIINIQRIKKIEATKLVMNEMANNHTIPVGRSHKKEVKLKFRQHFQTLKNFC